MAALLSSKSQLNEFCQVRKLLLPSYDTRFQGPPHARLFQSTVTISDQAFAGEECTTKKAAEQSAADIALAALRKQYEEIDKQTAEQAMSLVPVPAPKRRFSGVRGTIRGGRSKKRRGGAGGMEVAPPVSFVPLQNTIGNGEPQVHDVAAIATQLDHRLSVKHQQALPDVGATTAVASLIHVTNELLGTFRDSHNLLEFKLTKAYAQGLLTKDDLTVDAVIVFNEAPTKQTVNKLANSLKPMYDESYQVDTKGSVIVITDGTLTLQLATTYLQAWLGDFKLYPDPNSPDYVDITACQMALLSIRQVLWFEPNFLHIYSPNPRIIAKLFRLVTRRPELNKLGQFEQLVLIYYALKDPPARVGLSGALRQVFAYLASGQIYPGGDVVLNPVKDYKIHLFSKLTREEETLLAEFTREANQILIQPSNEIEAIMIKALEPDPAKVTAVVEWAQKTIKQVAFNENGWDSLFVGGLPPAPVDQTQVV